MALRPPHRVCIDFDANATQPLRAEVRERWIALLREGAGEANPASAHRLGQGSRALLEQARRRVAAALGADPLSVVFTSGGTESNNLALLGAARQRRKDGRPHGLALSRLEHPCVLQAAAQLQAEGHPVVWIDIDGRGRIAVEDLRQVVARPEIGLLALIWVQHELGNRMPMAEYLAQLGDGREDLWIHCDAVQAAGKIPLDFGALGADSLAISAHKFGGPKGVGALLLRRGLQLRPLVTGGAQERGFRGGTPNPALCDAMALALEVANQAQAQEGRQCEAIYDYLRTELSRLSPGRILGDLEHPSATTLCFLVPGILGETLMMALDLEGFAVSTGAACSVGSAQASPALLAMGFSEREARSVIRISWNAERSLDEARALVEALQRVLQRMHFGEVEYNE